VMAAPKALELCGVIVYVTLQEVPVGVPAEVTASMMVVVAVSVPEVPVMVTAEDPTAAVLLAALGIYSVIAFSAALRNREMAIRLALGSQRASVMQLVLASGAKLGLLGCGIGAVAAVLIARLMRSMLFQVDPLDPGVIVLAAIAIFLLALVASVIPARRAAAVEPMQALRAE